MCLLDLMKDKKYAITGESGTGKSTLLNIIAAKLTEYLGEVKLAGVDVKKQSYDELYRRNGLYRAKTTYLHDRAFAKT